MPCGSEGSAVRDSVRHASGCLEGELRSSREAVPKVDYVVFFFAVV